MEPLGSYFAMLPDEMVALILTFLPTYDAFMFFEAYPEYVALSDDKSVFREVNLQKEFRLQLTKGVSSFIFRRIHPEYIKVFNVNFIYWIPAAEIRNCIARLVNVENLYMLDTKMVLGGDETDVWKSLTKLRKLAIGVHPRIGTIKLSSLLKVKSLLLHFYNNVHHAILIEIAKIPSLEDLWIIDKSEHLVVTVVDNIMLQPNIKRFVYKVKTFIRVQRSVADAGHKVTEVYQNRRFGCVYFEKGDGGDLKTLVKDSVYDNHFERFWNSYHLLHGQHDPPYCVKDAKNLVKNDPSFSFEELNFMHEICVPRSNEIIKELLLSHTTRNLKKLSIQACLFNEFPEGFILDCVDTLEELEVWPPCNNSIKQHAYAAYHFLRGFVNLKRITLVVKKHPAFDFIEGVLMHCKKLESLSVKCYHEPRFMNCLLKSLKYAENLRDFRCQTVYEVRLDVLIEGLISLESRKIQRVVVEFQSAEGFKKQDLIYFLEKNPQLVLACFIYHQQTKRIAREVLDVLHKFKKNPIQLFSIRRQGELSHIPKVHLQEIVRLETHISTTLYKDWFNIMYDDS